MRAAILLACACACGRVGFDPRPPDATNLGNGFGSFGTSGLSIGKAIAFDPADGELVVGGDVMGSLTFGNVPIDASAETPFLTRLAGDGTIRWLQTFPVAAAGGGRVQDVAIAGDATYVTGFAYGTLDLGGGPLPVQQKAAFVASYTHDGAYRWGRVFDGGTIHGAGLGIAADSHGVVVAGSIAGAADFGGMVLAPTGGTTDMFIAAYTPDGTLRWARRAGDTRFNEIYGVALAADGSVYVTGFYEGTPDLGAGPVSAYRGIQDAFVLALDVNGVPMWSRDFGGTGFDWGKAVAVDASAVYVAGWYENTLSVPGNPALMPTHGGRDAFVVSYTLAGALRWVRATGGASCDLWWAIETTNDGHVVAGGAFNGTVDFGTGAVTGVGALNNAVAVDFDPATGATRTVGQYGGGGATLEGIAGPDLSSLYAAGYANGMPGQDCDQGETNTFRELAIEKIALP